MCSVCVNLLHICIVVYIYVCVVFVTMLDFETVDLGYNNPLVDKCDYIDHTMLDLTEHKDHVDLAIMQLNSHGLLGKLDKLKSLIQDVSVIFSGSFSTFTNNHMINVFTLVRASQYESPNSRYLRNPYCS